MLTIIGTGMSNYNLTPYINYIQNNNYIALNDNYINNNKKILKNKNIIHAKSFNQLKNKIKNVLKENKPINYFVTGSPTFYSGATALIEYLEKELPLFNKYKDTKIIQNISAKDYLLAKLAIKEKNVNTISCHNNDNIDLNYFLTKKYTLIIAKENTLKIIISILKYINTNNYSITIASKLGYNNENIFTTNNKNINTKKLMPYTLLIKKLFEHENYTYNEENFYQDKGMITKKDKRLLAISLLELKPNMILWDVGAGTGAIGITAQKIHKVYTVFFEKNQKRINHIKKNLNKYNVIGANIKEGDAITNIKKENTTPHRIVIGGGGQTINQNLNTLYDKLKNNGIIIAIFVSINSLTNAINTLKKYNIPFETNAISYTKYNKLYIAQAQRLSFIVKIQKTTKQIYEKI